ncbi:hypothetical protein ACJIZ3_008163 [Penstemon smallii]|uniref:Uncharacterized protein n=1 Tax=Penstemon smallii TaxID=265156 RepID=A0ABD3T9D3_9LAMI
MFGKNINTYLNLPQTSQHNEILVHHHHDLLSAHHYLAGGATNNLEAAATLYNNFNQDVVDHSTMVNPYPKKQPTKKDRHSKIHTAHGPRDRRVRLSIGIARKFFDLQELLNFDKPSKTLDWLLTKSKEAIKELVQSKSGNKTTSSNSEDLDLDLACEMNGNKGKKLVNSSNYNYKCKGVVKDSIAKESRVKARARARERTKEKMCIKSQLNEATTRNCNWGQLQFNQAPYNNIGQYEDLIQESVVIKKKMKQLPLMFGFHQQNHVSTSISSAPPPENWDYSNLASQSDQLCAILDQHKFIN